MCCLRPAMNVVNNWDLCSCFPALCRKRSKYIMYCPNVLSNKCVICFCTCRKFWQTMTVIEWILTKMCQLQDLLWQENVLECSEGRMFGGQVQTCFDLSLLVQTCQKGKKYDFFFFFENVPSTLNYYHPPCWRLWSSK